jgi:hypothetical protein
MLVPCVEILHVALRGALWTSLVAADPAIVYFISRLNPRPHNPPFCASYFLGSVLICTVRRRTSGLQKLCQEQARVSRLRPGVSPSSVCSVGDPAGSKSSGSVTRCQPPRPSCAFCAIISFCATWVHACFLTTFCAVPSLRISQRLDRPSRQRSWS